MKNITLIIFVIYFSITGAHACDSDCNEKIYKFKALSCSTFLGLFRHSMSDKFKSSSNAIMLDSSDNHLYVKTLESFSYKLKQCQNDNQLIISSTTTYQQIDKLKSILVRLEQLPVIDDENKETYINRKKAKEAYEIELDVLIKTLNEHVKVKNV
jgi:hypothetical protein